MSSIAATPALTGAGNRLLEATLLSSVGALAIAVCSVIPSLGQWWWLGLVPILSAVALLIVDIRISGRKQIMDRVLESMSDALGIPVAGTVQWRATESGAGWRARLVGTPLKLRVKLTVKAFDDLDLARKVAAAANEAWQPHRWGVESQNPRRGRLVLSTLSGDEIVLDDIKNRVHSVVGRVFGAGSRVTKFSESGAEVSSFTVTHTRGGRLSSSQVQNQVTQVVSSQLPGRWRAHYDLPKDVVTFERRPPLPKRINRPTTAINPGSPHWLEIPQAIDEDGEICYWNFSGPMAHQLKAGRTRTGKTVSLIGDAVEAARRGMRVFVADPKRIEFLGLRDWPNVALVVTTTQDIVALLYLLNQMMEDRYHAIEKGEATEADYDHVFLLLDEYRIMVGRIAEWYASIKVTGMPAKCPAIEWVGALLRMAAAARIHVILGTQRPDADVVGGEALAVDTPIATPTGWTTMGELTPGDHVLAPDGSPVRVAGATPVMEGRPCYLVQFSDGSQITADADHLWQVTSMARRSYRSQRSPKSRLDRWPSHRALRRQVTQAMKTLPAAAPVSEFEQAVTGGDRIALLRRGLNNGRFGVEAIRVEPSSAGRFPCRVYRSEHLAEALLVELATPPSTSFQLDQLLTTHQLAASVADNPVAGWAITATAPLELPEADLPIDPWLLGYWLGDGHHATATIATADEEVLDRVRGLGYTVVHYARYNYGIVTGGRGHRGDNLKTRLRELGVLGNKHVPMAYMRASASQRAELLSGLLDSDGSVAVRGHSGQVTFTNTNKWLIDAVAELAASLGFIPTIRPARPAGVESSKSSAAFGRTTKPSWIVRFTPDRQVFGIGRKQQRLAPSLEQRRRPTTTMRYITSITPVDSVPVRCITVDSKSHLFLAGRALIATHNCRDNFSSRGATGPLSPDGARMMFDDHSIGTGIPIGLRGRGTWLGEDGTPKEVQYFYTPDPRKATSPEELALLEALKPQTVTWSRQELDYGQAEIDPDSKAKQSLEWLQIQAVQLVDHTGTVESLPVVDQTFEADSADVDADDPEWVVVDVSSGALKAGDQIELDGGWVTLAEDPLEEGDSVLLDWLNDDSDSGISAISAEEMLTIRRPSLRRDNI